MSTQYRHCYPFGAQLRGHETEFRLWAPGIGTVALERPGQEPIPMRPEAEGWHSLRLACDAGTRYRYRIREDLAVPDPASRLQDPDVHGWSVVVDATRYSWQQSSWMGRPWTQTVIYELHAGALGGFRGVQDHLARLSALGITAVELMPIGDFPGRRNWGYDGVLPYAPDTAYGSPDDLKSLIDTAHGLGLMVFLDVVYNHFGPDGNYLHLLAPEFFSTERHTPWGAGIDFSRTEVRDYFVHNALYWLQEYRFDGLRFDAVHAIEDDRFLDELAQRVRDGVERGRHVHLMLENEHNESRHLEGGRYEAQWNDDAHNALHVLLTGERESYYAAYADAPAERLARVMKEGFSYQGEASPIHAGKPRGTSSAHLPPSAFIFFLQNHDQIGNRAMGERLTVLADAEALHAATVLQLLSPQIPLIFMGEEWGSRTPFLFFTDFHGELGEAVREGRRREFQAFAAFADESMRRRIPDPNASSTFEASVPDVNECMQHMGNRWLSRYQQLLALRRQYLVPRLSGARALGASAPGPHAVTGDWQLADGFRLRIVANLGAEPTLLPNASFDTGHSVLYETTPGVAVAAGKGQIKPYSACALMEWPR